MKLKNLIIVLLQLFVTFFLIVWICHNFDNNKSSINKILILAKLYWLIPSFLSFGITIIGSSWRWKMMLSAQNIYLPFFRIFQMVMIGMFYNLFLPGGTGGDVIKTIYAIREVSDKKSRICMSIFMDRFIGMLALVLITGYICWFYDSLLKTETFNHVLLWSIVIISTLFLLFTGFLGGISYSSIKYPRLINRYQLIAEIIASFLVYAHQWKILLWSTILSIIIHLFTFATMIFVVFEFSPHPSFIEMFPIVAIVNFFTALPISLSGIGVREEIFKTMLHTLYNIPDEIGLLISLSGFSVMVVWGLLGGICQIFMKKNHYKN